MFHQTLIGISGNILMIIVVMALIRALRTSVRIGTVLTTVSWNG